MSASLHALVLAAGLGTRLSPLTDQMPKPLVPVADQSILEHVWQQLQKMSASILLQSIHVNAHHLSEQLKQEADRIGFDKVWIEKPDILGTGGPLFRMVQDNWSGDLLILNSDNFMDLDLASFVNDSQASGQECSLLCMQNPQVNTLFVDSDQCMRGIKDRYCVSENSESKLGRATFSGISWYSEKALKRIVQADIDIRDFWEREAHSGRFPFAYIGPSDATWIDMGSPQGLYKAAMARLKQLKVMNYIHPSVEASDVSIGDGVIVAEGVRLGKDCVLENCLVLPGGEVGPGEEVSNVIIGSGFRWELS